MASRRRPLGSPKTLRVLLVGFDADPDLPAGVGGLPVDVVHRLETAADAAVSAEAVGADVVLGDAAMPELAGQQHSAAVALVHSETVHARALDFVEAVLAVASIRAFVAAER